MGKFENGNPGGPGGDHGGTFQNGHDPRRGVGVKGRSGRVPHAIGDLCHHDLDDPEVKAAALAILKDPSHPHHASIRKLWMGYAYGTPKQTIINEGEVPVFRVERG